MKQKQNVAAVRHGPTVSSRNNPLGPRVVLPLIPGRSPDRGPVSLCPHPSEIPHPERDRRPIIGLMMDMEGRTLHGLELSVATINRHGPLDRPQRRITNTWGSPADQGPGPPTIKISPSSLSILSSSGDHPFRRCWTLRELSHRTLYPASSFWNP